MFTARHFWLIIVAVAAVSLGLAAWCYSLGGPRQVVAPRGAEPDDYVGDQWCAACHQDIHAMQSHSRMARALATAGDGRLTPGEVIDPVNQLRYEVREDGGAWRLQVSRCSDDLSEAELAEAAVAPIAYLLGSGDRGLTPVSDLNADEYRELRISFYGDTRSWDFTPGQEVANLSNLSNALGRRIEKKGRLGCLSCHSTLLVQSGEAIDTAASRFGVHCERCHGPGRQHSEAAEKGEFLPTSNPAVAQATALAHRLIEGENRKSPQDRFLLSVARAGDDRLIRDLYMCGECHGRNAIHERIEGDELAMFQVAALAASRCFQESRGKLRCTDCHNPHRDVENADRSGYVDVCRKCHVGDRADRTLPNRRDEDEVAARVCPIDAEGQCVDCHMPKKTPMYRSRFTHHRIGLYDSGADETERSFP